MLKNIVNQATNILSGKPKALTKTSTSGTALGQDYGTYGLDQYKNMMERGVNAYGGPIVGAQGPNAAQTQQYNMLQGMYGTVPGAVGAAVGNMSPQQIAAMNRSGGPGAGYTSPYQDQMIAGANRDMEEAMRAAGNMESDMAQQYSAGGPSSVRSANQRYGAMGDIGLKYADMKNRIRDTGFRNAMGWQREDARDRASDITAMNQANLGFGGLRSNVAQADIGNKFNLANQYGLYGQGQQQQQNLADQFRYGEFNRQQNWEPNMLNNYMANVRNVPWQTKNVQTGEGKSDLNNLIGVGFGLAGAAGGLGWKPFS